MGVDQDFIEKKGSKANRENGEELIEDTQSLCDDELIDSSKKYSISASREYSNDFDGLSDDTNTSDEASDLGTN